LKDWIPAFAGMTKKSVFRLFTVKMRYAVPDVGQATPPAIGRHGGRPYIFMRRGRQDLRVMSVYERINIPMFPF